MLVTKLDGTTEEFSPEKLTRSLKNAGAASDVVQKIIAHIQKELRPGMTTSYIYRHARRLLHRHAHSPVAARYSLRRAILELGPSGYPFEDFLGAVLREKGYTVTVGTIMQGKCVPHEIDVVAKKEKELILIEAKFHNAQAFKTDVKVALYIHARFLDLQSADFDGLCPPGGACTSWLVTNTKFTDNAIRYGKCVGMTLIGWGYPAHGNVQDLIEETGLHPLSTLATLSKREREMLYTQGVVLCRDIISNPALLESAGVVGKKADAVLAEAYNLCNV
jgi:hypothetical protein